MQKKSAKMDHKKLRNKEKNVINIIIYLYLSKLYIFSASNLFQEIEEKTKKLVSSIVMFQVLITSMYKDSISYNYKLVKLRGVEPLISDHNIKH